MSVRALYLELTARGVGVRTGSVPDLGLSCSGIAALMRRVRENRAGLREVLADRRNPDLEAVRDEGRTK